MSATKSRSAVVKLGGTVIAGVQTKSVSVNGAPIDITSDDDSGYQTLLDDAGLVDVTIAVEGVCKNGSLRSTALSPTGRGAAMDFIYQGFEGSPGNTNGFSGRFVMSSYSEKGEYKDVTKFSAEFKSSGVITATA